MRDVIQLIEALDSVNVKAFLYMLRVGEGTAGADGYRTHFGGRKFDSYADHPREVITAGLGKNQYSSSAAGAYQFLTKTWDGLVAKYGFNDFQPKTQDIAACALIDGRGALDDVIAGRIEAAIKKCANEWASLPGSPYGQPTKTRAQALATYKAAGGLLAPFSHDAGTATPVKEPAQTLSQEKPMAPLLAALLPGLIQSIPALGKMFGSGSDVSERNVKAAEMAVSLVTEAVGAVNAQQAAEVVKNDPAMAQLAQAAVEAQWFKLTEAGGGIDGARKADADFVGKGANPIKSPAFIISCVLLVMPLMLLVDLFYVNPGNYAGEMRTQIITAVLLTIGIVGGYWLGSSFGSQRKDEIKAAQ